MVIVTSGGIDKLEVYKGLGIKEVWFFIGDRLDVYTLRNEIYDTVKSSELLPELDLALLTEYAIAPDPLEAAIAFREKIREG